MAADVDHFGTLPNGSDVQAITLVGSRLTAQILTHGARLHQLSFGGSPNLIAGSPDLKGYLGAERYAGAVVGPVANRLADATSEIGGATYSFEANEGSHCLHSGFGTQDIVWEIAEIRRDMVCLTCTLEHLSGGFPGNRTISATYSVADADLRLELRAKSDTDTLMNLAHHAYWAMDGEGSWDGHRLSVAAESHLLVDAEKIPTGEIAAVEGTAYDHRALCAPDPSLDHNFCFHHADAPRHMAWLEGKSGRAVEVLSDAPGLQVYAGDPRGIALEPQCWPDAPNHTGFPSIRLSPGDTFRQDTIFRLWLG